MLSDERRKALYAYLEDQGEDQVRADMEQTGGMRCVGGPPDTRKAAWDWLAMKKREREQAAPAPSYSVVIHGPQAQVMLGSSNCSQTMTINWQGDIEQRIGSFVDAATQKLTEIRDAADAEDHEHVSAIVADLDAIKRQLARAQKNPIVIVELLKSVVADMTALGAVHVVASAPILAPVLEQGQHLLKLLGLS